MTENQFALWQVADARIFDGAEVTELLSNKRAKLLSELKNAPVIYYDYVYPLKKGQEILKSIRALQQYNDEQIIHLHETLKEQVQQIVQDEDNRPNS